MIVIVLMKTMISEMRSFAEQYTPGKTFIYARTRASPEEQPLERFTRDGDTSRNPGGAEGYVLAFVDDRLAVLTNKVFHLSFSVEALDDGNIHTTRPARIARTDMAD